MLNELNEISKSNRSIENSEIDSLKKKSQRDSYLEPDKRNKEQDKEKSNQNKSRSYNKIRSSIIPSQSQSEFKELIPTPENLEEKIIHTQPDNPNTKNIRPYNKSQNVLSEDIIEFQKKTECTYYQYGNFPVYQRVFFCDFCDTNSTEKICEFCYLECHSSCSGNLKNDDDTNSNGIPDNLFINYDEEENLKFMHGKFLTFICSCGLKKHKL